MFDEFAGESVMLLQGPIGPFFSEVAEHLQSHDASVVKINLNAADDWFFSGAPVLHYRETLERWPEFVAEKMREYRGNSLFVFGDSRVYHAAAIKEAAKLGVRVYVFEEGYVRPDYITFEPGGTNFNTTVPSSLDFYRGLSLERSPRPRPVGNTFWWTAWYAIIYSLLLTYFSKGYPHYPHHRDMRAGPQARSWWRSAFRKSYYGFLERGELQRLTSHEGGYFLVPLQVHDDFQVKNSRFDDVEQFIGEVVESFATNAPSETWLVFKHHPRDRGFRDYTELLVRLGEQYGIRGRIAYVHDLHLPTLLKRALGTIVINSTVGLSSLYHGTPVKCLSRSVYDMFDSTETLAQFWVSPPKVDRALVRTYIHWLERNVLINGTFYRPRFWPKPPKRRVVPERETPHPRSASLGD